MHTHNDKHTLSHKHKLNTHIHRPPAADSLPHTSTAPPHRAYRIPPDSATGPALALQPGELVAKVGYFGVKSAKVYRVQMGTKPAKVGRLGPRCAKVRRGPHPAPTGASAKRSSIHAASKVAKVGAAGGPKLLKWGRLRARQGQIC